MYKSVGQELRQARLDQGWTLEQVSESTHLRVHYLEALEAGDFDSLPSMTQARGFLRVYAGFLKLDPHNLLDILDGPDPELDDAPYIPYQTESQESPEVTEAEQARVDLTRKSDQLMVELGQHLRQQREVLGLTLEDVERHTHLRVHYLRALENGDLEALPSPVQGRGMLKNYADFLGMSPDPLLLSFADAIQAQHAARQPEPTRPREPEKKPSPISPLRRLFTGDLFLTGGIILVLVLFVSWGVFQIASARSEQTPTPQAPSIADVLMPEPTATSTLEPSPTPGNQENLPLPAAGTSPAGEALPTQALNLPALDPSQGNLQVYVSASQRGWMRVTVDGEVQFEGQVLVGTVYPFAGSDQIEVVSGNGAGLVVYYNGQNMGPMGQFGEVVDLIYTMDGILLPTPTVTPTITQTPRVTPTAFPTQLLNQP
jgi:cytoskeleton protein RodZ